MGLNPHCPMVGSMSGDAPERSDLGQRRAICCNINGNIGILMARLANETQETATLLCLSFFLEQIIGNDMSRHGRACAVPCASLYVLLLEGTSESLHTYMIFNTLGPLCARLASMWGRCRHVGRSRTHGVVALNSCKVLPCVFLQVNRFPLQASP